MRDYALKRAMKDKQQAPPAGLIRAIVRAKPTMLDYEHLNTYKPLDPHNGRMRGLMDDMFREHLEQNLWIPPSLPYYGAGESGGTADQGPDILILVYGSRCDSGASIL